MENKMKSFCDMVPSYKDYDDKLVRQTLKGVLLDYQCVNCGKAFTIPHGYSGCYRYYRYKGHKKVFFCSWTCLNKYDKER